MGSIIHISEAVTIGLHAAICLGSDPERNWSAREIVERFSFSEAHLAKVMAGLARAGIVRAERGRHGGARLSRAPENVTLLEIYEAIDGPMAMEDCLLAPDGCGSKCCQLGPKLAAHNEALRKVFATTTLADLAYQGSSARRPATGARRQ